LFAPGVPSNGTPRSRARAPRCAALAGAAAAAGPAAGAAA